MNFCVLANQWIIKERKIKIVIVSGVGQIKLISKLYNLKLTNKIFDEQNRRLVEIYISNQGIKWLFTLHLTSTRGLTNISKNKECVIGLVTENIAQQVSLASSNFPSEDDEFMKAGLSKQRATAVSPSLIKDSPINFECKVNSIIELGQEGGSGNLVICEVLKIHIDEKLFDSQNNIDPLKLKIVSRLGGSWYGKTNQESLYKMSKPISKIGIGFDHLPVNIKNSSILSGADLAVDKRKPHKLTREK